jgi:hypothetical protein
MASISARPQTWQPVSLRASLVSASVLLAVAAALYALVAQTRFQFGVDPSIYISTAKSLAAGMGYNVAGRAQTEYPPGWPLLLLICDRLSAGDYAAFARFTAALFPLVIAATWLLYRRRGESHAEWLIVWLAASGAVFDIVTREVRSEITYMAFSIGFLAWAARPFEAGESPMTWLRTALLGSVLLLGTVATRSVGVALVLAIALAGLQLYARNRAEFIPYVRRHVGPVCAGIAFMAAWRAWIHSHRSQAYTGEFMNSYGGQFWMRDPHQPDLGRASVTEVLSRIPGNLRIQAGHTAEMFTNVAWLLPSLTSPLVVAVLFIVLVGLLEELRSPRPLLAWYVIAFAAVLAVWPFDEGTRFVVPLFPLLAVLFAGGVRVIAGWLTIRPRASVRFLGVISVTELATIAIVHFRSGLHLSRQEEMAMLIWAAALAFALLNWRRESGTLSTALARGGRALGLAYAAAYLVLGVRTIGSDARANVNGETGARAQLLHAVSDWLVSHAPDSTVVMAQSYASLAYATGRQFVPLPITSDGRVLRSAVEQQHPSFLVIADSAPDEYFFPPDPRRLQALEKETGNPLVVAASLRGGAIYRVREPATGTTARRSADPDTARVIPASNVRQRE